MCTTPPKDKTEGGAAYKDLKPITATHQFSDGGSATMGISAGAGFGGSVGAKDTPDGGTAVCVQVSALFFTVGACIPMGRM